MVVTVLIDVSPVAAVKELIFKCQNMKRSKIGDTIQIDFGSIRDNTALLRTLLWRTLLHNFLNSATNNLTKL